jgi:hypothetical protein
LNWLAGLCAVTVVLLVACWLIRDAVVTYLAQPVPLPGSIRLPLNMLSKLGQLAVPTMVALAFALQALGSLTRRRIVLLVMLGAAWCITVTFGPRMGNLGVDSMRELMGANWSEAQDFLVIFVLTPGYRGRDIALTLLPALAVLALRWSLPSVQGHRGLRMVSVVLSALFAMTLAASLAFYARAQWDDIATADTFSQEAARLVEQLPPRAGQAVNVVLYIGESTSALHQSLMGYQRQTNAPLAPWASDLMVFRDVMSVHSFTREVLMRALSVARDPLYDQLVADRDLKRANLIEVLNRSGVHTHWLSNQSRAGSWDFASQLFGKAAMASQFLNFEVANATFDVRRFDHELLPLLQSSLDQAAGSNLFVLHSYAGHHDYCRNIPQEAWLRFDDAQARIPWEGLFGMMHKRNRQEHLRSIDCYDSAMHYVSDNIAKVLTMVRAQQAPTVFFYFADHGEDPLGGTSHDAALPRLTHLAVPMFLYANPAAQVVLADKLEAARKNLAKPYSLGWMSDTLLDALGFKLPGRPMQSLLSSNLRALPRYALVRQELFRGKSHVSLDVPGSSGRDRSDDVMKLKRLIGSLDAASQERLCVHRNDSLYKFLTISFFAGCVEVDLSIDVALGTIHAYHPPRADNGLAFHVMLDSAGPKLRRVWLDVKNAEPQALVLLRAELVRARKRHPNLEFMVEIQPGLSIQPAQVAALRALRALGQVTTLFYLPQVLTNQCDASADPAACTKALAAIDHALEAGQFEGISFDTSLLTHARRLFHYDRLTRHVWGDVPRPDPRDSEFSTVLIPVETDFDY